MGRRVLAMVAAAVFVALVSACSPTAPSEPPTAAPSSQSEDEVIADAEDAYLAYIAALNQVDLSDPTSFEPVYAATTGPQNELHRTQYAFWHAENYTSSGDLEILWLDLDSVSESSDSVRFSVCLDRSAVTFVDASGQSQEGEGAQPVSEWLADVVKSPATGEWQVEATSPAEGVPSCSAR